MKTCENCKNWIPMEEHYGKCVLYGFKYCAWTPGDATCDEWKDDVCDGCAYKKTDWTNPKNEDCYCSNCASDNYGYNVDLIAKCDMKGE